MLISGHLVVRKPEWNYDFSNTIPPFLQYFKDSQLHEYRGIDRFAWFDFGSAYYAKSLSLPKDLLYKSLNSSKNYWFSSFTPTDLATAEEICCYSNYYIQNQYASIVLNNSVNEIVAVYSDYLADYLNEAISVQEDTLEFLGYDAISIGEWSLIQHGLFFPNYDKFCSKFYTYKWKKILNLNGLFNSLEEAQSYTFDYEKDMILNNIEECGKQYDYPKIYTFR